MPLSSGARLVVLFLMLLRSYIGPHTVFCCMAWRWNANQHWLPFPSNCKRQQQPMFSRIKIIKFAKVHVAIYMGVVGFVHCFTPKKTHTLVSHYNRHNTFAVGSCGGIIALLFLSATGQHHLPSFRDLLDNHLQPATHSIVGIEGNLLGILVLFRPCFRLYWLSSL